MKKILSAIKESLNSRISMLVFIGTIVFMLFLFLFIPVWVIPYNNVSFQLSIFKVNEVLLLLFLSLLYALYITMQIYVFRVRKKKVVMREGIQSMSGGFGALLAGITGSAACSACIAPLFAFFGIGFGGVLLVIEYRVYVITVIIILMTIAIYYTARKINNSCKTCIAPKQK